MSTERNARVQARYDELMREGKHGHYETLFRVVNEECASQEASLVGLRGALKPFAAVIDALSSTQDLDRDAQIEPFPTIHFNGPGASGGCSLKPEYFYAAKAALSNTPAHDTRAEQIAALVAHTRNLITRLSIDPSSCEYDVTADSDAIDEAETTLLNLPAQGSSALLDDVRRIALEEAAKVADKAAQPMECNYLNPMDPTTGAVECSLSNRGRDCLCIERQEAAEAIAKAIRALSVAGKS